VSSEFANTGLAIATKKSISRAVFIRVAPGAAVEVLRFQFIGLPALKALAWYFLSPDMFRSEATDTRMGSGSA